MEEVEKKIFRKDLYLPCTCETELLRVSKWEDDEEVYFSVYSFFAQKYSFLERLKFLFGGKIKSCEIILKEEDFNKLKSF